MRKRTLWRISSLGLIAILGLMLAGCGVFKVVDADVAGQLGFEDGNAGDVPEEWTMESPLHTLQLDSEVKHSGRFSGRLTNKDRDLAAEEDSGMAKHCSALQYRDKVVRASGFLKVETGAANLVIDGPNYPESTAVWHLQTADIRGPQDWTEYELFTNNLHHSRASEVCIYFELKGVGTVWADDFSIEEVDAAGLSSKAKPIPLPNLDMESRDKRGRLSGWTLEEPQAELGADLETKRSGAASAHLSWSEFSADGARGGQRVDPLMARYCNDPGPFAGTVVRVAGWIRSVPRGEAALVPHLTLAAYWPNESWSAFVVRNIESSSEWTRHEVIASVPAGSTRVCFGFAGSKMWADDFTVETLAL